MMKSFPWLIFNTLLLTSVAGGAIASPLPHCYTQADPAYRVEGELYDGDRGDRVALAAERAVHHFAKGTPFVCTDGRRQVQAIGTGEQHFFSGLEVVGLPMLAAIAHLTEQYSVYELHLTQSGVDSGILLFNWGLMEYRLQIQDGIVVDFQQGSYGP